MQKPWRDRRTGDHTLEAWEILAEEFESAGNDLDDSLDHLINAYGKASEEYKTLLKARHVDRAVTVRPGQT